MSLGRRHRRRLVVARRHVPTQPSGSPPTGSASSKIEPSESDLTSRNLPSWFSTTVEQIASPNPIPLDFVVKNGSKMRYRSSRGIPGPESCTDSNTVE
jgi:hypothetical protein